MGSTYRCRPKGSPVPDFIRLVRAAAEHAPIAVPPLLDPVKDTVKRRLFRYGVLQWGTKSFECWLLLMVLLGTFRPRSIVELGSGRSSSYLGDYAMKTGARYVSLEQSRVYARRVRRALALGFVDPGFVHYVPVRRDGWYDAERLARLVDFRPELLFIDGPVGRQEGFGAAMRNGGRALDWHRAAAQHARLLVVDDVHRASNLVLHHDLTERMPGVCTLYLAYSPQAGSRNVMAVALPADRREFIARTCVDLRIDLLSSHTLDDCTEP